MMGNILRSLGVIKGNEEIEQAVRIRRKRVISSLSPLFLELFLTGADVLKLYDLFAALDVDKTGVITETSFLHRFHLEGTKFVEALFFSFNFEGGVTFPHFAVMMYFFCSVDEKELGEKNSFFTYFHSILYELCMKTRSNLFLVNRRINYEKLDIVNLSPPLHYLPPFSLPSISLNYLV